MTKFVWLHKIYDAQEFNVRNLKSLKVETSSWGSLLGPLFNEKLPIYFNLARKFKDGVWKLDNMLIFLKTEIEAGERSISLEFLINSLENKIYKNSSQSYSTSALSTHKSKKADPFFNLVNQSASKSLKVTNPNIRKQILRRKRFCFI